MISVDGSKNMEKATVLSSMTTCSKNSENILSILTKMEVTLSALTNWKTLSFFSACVTPKSKWMNFSKVSLSLK